MFVTSPNPLFSEVTSPIRNEVVGIWERLYADDEDKDVEMHSRDGVVRVHGNVLAQISEPMKCMLRSGMRESHTKKIDMPDYTVAQLSFILRLAYTGHVDSSDWEEPEDEREADREQPREAERPNFFASRPCDMNLSMGLSGGGISLGMPSALPIATNPSGNGGFRPDGISFGGPPAGSGAGGCFPIPSGFVSPNLQAGLHAANTNTPQPPLNLLFGCASFSKKYEVPGFLSMMLEKIKPRLTIQSFDEVMRFAVALDFLPLKVYCAKFAEGEGQVRKMFNDKRLSPEVEFELQALWGCPPVQRHNPKRAPFC